MRHPPILRSCERERADGPPLAHARGHSPTKAKRFAGLRTSPSLRKKAAFTFIEVLVALAIFALAGVALAATCVNFLQAQHAAFQQDATDADRELARQALQAEPSRQKAGQWNELSLPGHRIIRWRADITPAPVADLFDVALEIELPGESGQPAQVTENLRLLRPTWSQPAEREVLRAVAARKLAQRGLP